MPFRSRRKRKMKFRSRRKKRRRTRSPKKSLTKKVAILTKKVKDVKAIAESGIGYVTYRERYTWQSTTPTDINLVFYNSYNLCSGAALERFLKKLYYYDIDLESSLVTANGNSGLYQRVFNMKTSFNWTVRNNYIVPVKVRLYLCLPKVITNLSPFTSISNSFTTQQDTGDGLINSPLMFPSDCIEFGETWNIKRSWIKQLMPGAELHGSYVHPPFNYDPSFDDAFDKDFYPMYCGASLLSRVEGVVQHSGDFTASGLGKIDVQTNATCHITYDAGVSLHKLVVNDQSDMELTTPVLTQKNIAVMQDFSRT